MRSTPEHGGKGLSLARGLFLVFGYVIASSILGLAVAVATIHALYPGVAEWRRPAVVAGLSLAVIVVCWLTMPANRPHVGVPDLEGGNGGMPRGRGIRGEAPSVRAQPCSRWRCVHPDRHGSRVRDRALYRSWYALG